MTNAVHCGIVCIVIFCQRLLAMSDDACDNVNVTAAHVSALLLIRNSFTSLVWQCVVGALV